MYAITTLTLVRNAMSLKMKPQKGLTGMQPLTSLDEKQLGSCTISLATPMALNSQTTALAILYTPKNKISQFLTLLEVPFKSTQWPSNEEPLIDYSKSIMMTSDHYMVLKQKLASKEVVVRKKDDG